MMLSQGFERRKNGAFDLILVVTKELMDMFHSKVSLYKVGNMLGIQRKRQLFFLYRDLDLS
jgi:hypothetical protein